MEVIQNQIKRTGLYPDLSSLTSIAPIVDYSTKQLRDPYMLMSHSLDTTFRMNRVMIIGSSGSGKSTLARQLGATLNLPVHHLDKYFWHPGWEATPADEWENKVGQLVEDPRWIIDGNYRRTLDHRLGAADTIVFLDLPPWLCAVRAVKRRFMYLHQPRPDMARGCKEPILDPKFPRFVRWILDYPNRARPDVTRRLSQLDDSKNIIWLQSTANVNKFLANPLSCEFLIKPHMVKHWATKEVAIPQMFMD